MLSSLDQDVLLMSQFFDSLLNHDGKLVPFQIDHAHLILFIIVVFGKAIIDLCRLNQSVVSECSLLIVHSIELTKRV